MTPSKIVETKEVCVAMCATEHFECVLCNFKAYIKIIYQVGCGIHECEDCDMRVKFLNDMKTHIDK